MDNETKKIGAAVTEGLTESEEQEAKRQFFIRNESDILEGLLKTASFKSDDSEIHPVEITRNGEVTLSFRIHPLSEDDFMACRKRHTKYKKNRQAGGIKVADEVDASAYRSAVIYEATVEEDRRKIWDNKAAWEKLDVIAGYQLVERVLKGGEKDAIYDKIEEISGYGSVEEIAKN